MTIIISVIVAIALAIGYLAVPKKSGLPQLSLLNLMWGKSWLYQRDECDLRIGCTESLRHQASLIGRYSTAFSALAETLVTRKKQKS